MVGDGTQRGVGRIGESDLNGLIVLVQGIVHHREVDILGGHTGGEA